MDENDDMLGALITTSITHANTPPSSTDDGRVFSLGVQYNCSQHSDAFNALAGGLGDSAFDPPRPRFRQWFCRSGTSIRRRTV